MVGVSIPIFNSNKELCFCLSTHTAKSRKDINKRISNFFDWIKGAELVELKNCNTEEDPVRPELDNTFRTTKGRKIFGLKYKEMVKSLVIAGVGSGAMPQHRKGFYSMANELADDFIKKGSKKAASIISNSGSRIQLKNKDLRGWLEFKKHLEEHSNIGSALTMQQYQALRPSLMDFENEFKRMNIPVLLAVGDEDELCLEINIYLKRQIKTSGLWICSRTSLAIIRSNVSF